MILAYLWQLAVLLLVAFPFVFAVLPVFFMIDFFQLLVGGIPPKDAFGQALFGPLWLLTSAAGTFLGLEHGGPLEWVKDAEIGVELAAVAGGYEVVVKAASS